MGDNKELDFTCKECDTEIDIMSVTIINKNSVNILFICPGCGRYKEITSFLYKQIRR